MNVRVPFFIILKLMVIGVDGLTGAHAQSTVETVTKHDYDHIVILYVYLTINICSMYIHGKGMSFTETLI